MIEIQNITKIYGKQTVLKNVTAKLEEGKIYGLVGVNGSGKTTLMRCICGFTRPTSGKVIVNGKVIGKDVDFPESTGIIIETPGFLAHYSGLRNLKLLAGVSHKADEARARAVMKMVKLDPIKKRLDNTRLECGSAWASHRPLWKILNFSFWMSHLTD